MASLHFTSLHFSSLHFTPLHFISLHFTSLGTFLSNVAIIPPKVVPFRFAERNGTTFGGMLATSPYRYIEINN